MLYDAAIIGTGPAGLSAALNLKLHNKSVLWLGAGQMSGKVGKSEKIRNYPGFPEITGGELNARFRAQAEAMELEITDRMVTNIMDNGGSFLLLAQNEVYEARTILLALGAAASKGFEGEEALLGSGVSYCATCDGFLYRGKKIAVYCANTRYEHEVADLAGIAETVYYFTPDKGSTLDLPNLIRLTKPIRRVLGERHVTGIELTDGGTLEVDGLFCLRDSVAPGVLLPGLEMDGPHIAVNRNMETNQPGCFAAGDCTGRPYQIAKAVGEGNTAAHRMLEFLAGKA